MKLPKTTRGLMILVAIVALVLGIAINTGPFLPLIVIAAIILSPQIIVVGICAYLSPRQEPHPPPEVSPKPSPRQ
jgi:hypothetical protein